MRILSLIPAATEIVYLLGLGNKLVGRSHDSNFPHQVRSLPVLTEADINPYLSSREIDDAVMRAVHTGRSLFHINQNLLWELKPTLILTQELCRVCAPSFNEVQKAARILNGKVSILSLEPHSIEETFQNILTVGEYTGTLAKAFEVVEALKAELSGINTKLAIMKKGLLPKIVVVEWLDPVMIAGHWVPEMVEISGGIPLLSQKFKKSRRSSWKEIKTAKPEVLIIAPCGFDIRRTKIELGNSLLPHSLIKEGMGEFYLVDGDAYLTRPGPRLVEGVKILAKIFHPEIFGKPRAEETQGILD